MKEFRALLRQGLPRDPGLYGLGLGAPLGRCLDQPDVQGSAESPLIRAEEAAAGDRGPAGPDACCGRERNIFAYTWEAARKTYLENYKELNVYRKTSSITNRWRASEQD